MARRHPRSLVGSPGPEMSSTRATRALDRAPLDAEGGSDRS